MRGTLALLGLGLTGLALAHARRFARIDRTMPQPGKEVDLLRGLPMFAPLPLAATELLATDPDAACAGPARVWLERLPDDYAAVCDLLARVGR